MSTAGFSTGALATADYCLAMSYLKKSSANAIELSALRITELEPLVEALDTLDLRQFSYVSIHAPSAFERHEEPRVIELLRRAADMHYFVVVHPDTMHDIGLWKTLGSWLCIENMDKRKKTGRTASELAGFFAHLPEASMCFDIAHARQLDSSMIEAYRILTAFSKRIKQVHISEVNTSSKHDRISAASAADFREVAALIPSDAAIIVEAPVGPDDMESELARSRNAIDAISGSP